MERVEHGVQRDAFAVVTAFRTELHASLLARGDALFKLCDALLGTDRPVRTLVDLALAPEHRRGALYAGLNQGRVDVALLRRVLVGVPLPRAADGRLVLAVDVPPWLRPDADTCSDRSFCHTFGRGMGKHRWCPAGPTRSSPRWRPAAPPGPRCSTRSGWNPAPISRPSPPPRSARSSNASSRRASGGGVNRTSSSSSTPHDAPRIARLLKDTPIEVLGRLRPDRVMRKPVPVPWICPPQGGRPPKHGGECVFGDPATRGEASTVTSTTTQRYGTPTAQAWDRLPPRLTRRTAWGNHEGPLPIIEGTVIRLTVAKLPSGGVNKPVRLWWSGTGIAPEDVDRCWRAFLRRLDVEHTLACSGKPSAGLGPSSATPPRPTAGRGSSWPHTRNSASPGHSHGTSPDRGNDRRNRTGSPRPASAGGSGTCAHGRARRLVHRNPPDQAPTAHSARRTSSPSPATTSDASSPPPSPAPSPHTTRPAPSPGALDARQA